MRQGSSCGLVRRTPVKHNTFEIILESPKTREKKFSLYLNFPNMKSVYE